jgi:xeroderma pigmentosum group C-complementing protein
LLTFKDDEASRSARLLGIDYADALTGFEFRGRHGTAVLKGIIVAAEYAEAVEAVIEGFRDERAQAEEERRVAFALRMWKRFLVTLRIKARIDMYEIEGEDEIYNPIGDKSGDQNLQAEEEDSGMETEEYIDGGGFFPE